MNNAAKSFDILTISLRPT